MRKRMLIPLAVAAILLAACEIRTDYDLAIADDASATLAFDMFYDMEAAELLGPAEEFMEEEIQGDVGIEEDGVTLVSADAGLSDDGYRISAVFAATDGVALDGLVDEMFPGSTFTSSDGVTWTLTLRPDADIAEDFDDELDLGELGLDFISGEVRLEHAGSQVSMSGGTSEGGNRILWDPYGSDSLEVVMDLSGASPPAGGDEVAADEPEEPEAETPVEEEAPATDEDADTGADADAEDTGSDAEPAPGDSTDELDAVAAADADEGGLSTALLAGIIGALLFLIIVVGALMLMKRRGKAQQAASAQPVAAAAGPQGGWEQTQQQGWQQTPGQQPPAQQGYDQTQQMPQQPQAPQQGWQPPQQDWQQPQQQPQAPQQGWQQPQAPQQGWQQPQQPQAPQQDWQQPPSDGQPPRDPNQGA